MVDQLISVVPPDRTRRGEAVMEPADASACPVGSFASKAIFLVETYTLTCDDADADDQRDDFEDSVLIVRFPCWCER